VRWAEQAIWVGVLLRGETTGKKKIDGPDVDLCFDHMASPGFRGDEERWDGSMEEGGTAVGVGQLEVTVGR
jgi:hypothetical protein